MLSGGGCVVRNACGQLFAEAGPVFFDGVIFAVGGVLIGSVKR